MVVIECPSIYAEPQPHSHPRRRRWLWRQWGCGWLSGSVLYLVRAGAQLLHAWGCGSGCLGYFAPLPLGPASQKQGFRTSWYITGQKLQVLVLKLKAFELTFRDVARHLCQEFMRMAR